MNTYSPIGVTFSGAKYCYLMCFGIVYVVRIFIAGTIADTIRTVFTRRQYYIYMVHPDTTHVSTAANFNGWQTRINVILIRE